MHLSLCFLQLRLANGSVVSQLRILCLMVDKQSMSIHVGKHLTSNLNQKYTLKPKKQDRSDS